MGTLGSALQPIAARLLQAPRVYVDANMPAGSVALMRRQLRWDVVFVLEEADWRRASDRDHFTRALALGRTLVTLDQDFSDDRRFPPALSPGLVICSAPDARALARILRHVDRTVFRVAAGDLQPLRGRKLTVTPDSLSLPRRRP